MEWVDNPNTDTLARNAPRPTVLRAVGDRLDRGETGVLVTVVDVEGSGYRRPGATALVTEEGGVGSVSAGCLTSRVERLAAEVRAGGGPQVATFDLTGDAAVGHGAEPVADEGGGGTDDEGDDGTDDEGGGGTDDEGDGGTDAGGVWGLGLGCNGVVTLLFEPVDDSLAPAVGAVRRGEPVVSVTPVEPDGAVGRRLYVAPDGRVVRSSPELSEAFVTAAVPVAREYAAAGRSGTTEIDAGDGSVRAFVDTVEPAPRLALFGAEHDAAPVAALARRNGFHVTVVAFRDVAPAERVPAAHRAVVTSPVEVAEAVDLDERTYAVVMSHSFVDDRLVLGALLDTPVPYVGLLGPRERFRALCEALDRDGEGPSAADRDRLYAPVGLDLGAGGPQGVATSVVAELLAVHNDREPRHLRDRDGPVHPRPE